MEYLKHAPDDVTADGIRLAFDLADPRQSGSAMQRRLEVASANTLLKAWFAAVNAVDTGEVAVRVARALAASPDSSAVWLTSEGRRYTLTNTLRFRGHLREAAAALSPDPIVAPAVFAELALQGLYPPTPPDSTSTDGYTVAISGPRASRCPGGRAMVTPARSCDSGSSPTHW